MQSLLEWSNPRNPAVLAKRFAHFKDAYLARAGTDGPPAPFYYSIPEAVFSASGEDLIRITCVVTEAGNVVSWETEPAVPEDAREALQAAVGSWRFFPSMSGGRYHASKVWFEVASAEATFDRYAEL
jgi:hypothetical protein